MPISVVYSCILNQVHNHWLGLSSGSGAWFMVRFHCPTPIPIPIPTPIPMKWTKAPLGLIPMVIPMQSYYEKLLKLHHISTDICAKLGTVAIGIGIGITIRISVGSVETVLHIIIEHNFIGIGIGIGVGIWIGQWKHTIRLFVLLQ